jgi:general stress protein YciG
VARRRSGVLVRVPSAHDVCNEAQQALGSAGSTAISESNEHVEHLSTDRTSRGKSVMSAGIMGTQPHTTHDKSHQMNEHEAQALDAHSHELTPDRPPQAVEHSANPSDAKAKRPRGFAAMDRKLVSEIARKGGKAAHSAGTAHEFTSDEARAAGRKGGRATHAKRRRLSEDEHGKSETGNQGE